MRAALFPYLLPQRRDDKYVESKIQQMRHCVALAGVVLVTTYDDWSLSDFDDTLFRKSINKKWRRKIQIIQSIT